MKNFKILIVEDELLIAKDLSLILERDGYTTVYGITNVNQALNEIANADFDMVLIDINLSQGTDGVTIGNFLQRKKKVPFIYITSYSDPLTLERIKDTRPYGIIIKPFKPHDVLASVSIALHNFKHSRIDMFGEDDDLMVCSEVPFILKNIIEHIDDNIGGKIDVTELSKLTKWSLQHFIKVFNKYMGQSPYKYILQKKIDRSKALICTTDYSLSEIAFELGFNSYSNFFNAFKRETGISPEEFKKQQSLKKLIK